MNKIISTIFATLLLCSCASQPAKIANTSSGFPEIDINTKNKSLIKEKIISINASKGWSLEQESDSSLYFTKLDDSGSMNSIMTQALIGNQYSTPPKAEARYTITSINNKTRIIVNVDISTQMPGGQINKISLRENNQVFNAVQTQLINVKNDVEKQSN